MGGSRQWPRRGVPGAGHPGTGPAPRGAGGLCLPGAGPRPAPARPAARSSSPTGSSSRACSATPATPTGSPATSPASPSHLDYLERARRHLPAPDAAAAAARGRQRRRLRRAGLPRGARRPRHHRRPARAGHATLRARGISLVPRPGAQPRRPRARVGACAPGPARRRYRDYFHVFPDRDDARRLRAHAARGLPRLRARAASPGTTSSTAGSGRRSTTGSGTSTGPTPTCCVEYADIVLFLANLGVEVLRLDAIAFIWKRLGTNCQNQPEVHALTQALRAVARIACPAVVFKAEAIVGPRDLVQYLGPGPHAGKVSDLAYHNSLMVQVWSMLATRRRRPRRAGARGAAADAADRHLDHLRPLPRRHRLGDRRRRRRARSGWTATRTAGSCPTGTPATFPGSWARGLVFQDNPATGDRRISGTAASLAGLAEAAPSPDGERRRSPGCSWPTPSSRAGAASR